MGQQATILEAAVDKGRQSLTPEQAGEEIVRLLCQIGELENCNAELEAGIEAISAKCYWRVMGYCDLGCGGRVFCGVTGLRGFDWSRMGCSSPSPQLPPVEAEGEAGGHMGPPLRGDEATLDERSPG